MEGKSVSNVKSPLLWSGEPFMKCVVHILTEGTQQDSSQLLPARTSTINVLLFSSSFCLYSCPSTSKIYYLYPSLFSGTAFKEIQIMTKSVITFVCSPKAGKIKYHIGRYACQISYEEKLENGWYKINITCSHLGEWKKLYSRENTQWLQRC